jgi:protein-S-isoprenylcysteine O-methyltransferase Ste14
MTTEQDSQMSRERFNELASKVVVAALFTTLWVNLLGDFMRTGHITGLFLLASEALVVVFTIVRRPARTVDRSVVAAAMTSISMAAPALLRAADSGGLVSDAATALLSVVGLTLIIAGKLTLGRSFGLVPANRGVVARGPYSFVRHPIYAGYLTTHLAFLIAHPRPWNLAVLLVADTALVLRALKEERLLATDIEYEAYCRRVGWHLVPGVF